MQLRPKPGVKITELEWQSTSVTIGKERRMYKVGDRIVDFEGDVGTILNVNLGRHSYPMYLVQYDKWEGDTDGIWMNLENSTLVREEEPEPKTLPSERQPEEEPEPKTLPSERQPEGLKYDTDKMRWLLLPWDVLREVVKVFEYGAKKYKPYNWQNVENLEERYTNALLRHMTDHINGEKKDRESGCWHLACVITNAMFLLWKELKNERPSE
jgi:hypothetical protein